MAITLFSKPNFLIAWSALWETISAVSPVISTKSSTFVLISKQLSFSVLPAFISTRTYLIRISSILRAHDLMHR
jgi:hypothetical protein